MDEETSLELLREQHSTLSASYDALMAACKNDEQRTQLRRAKLRAAENLAEARLRIFEENDPAVRELTTRLKEIETQLKDALGAFQNVQRALDVATAAVDLGKRLIELGRSDE